MRTKLLISLFVICFLVLSFASCANESENVPLDIQTTNLTYPSNIIFTCTTDKKEYAPYSERLKTMFRCKTIAEYNPVDSLKALDTQTVISCFIPHNLSNLTGAFFCNFENLQSITVDNNNTALASVDGVLYSKSLKTLLAYPSNKSGTYCILEDVEHIGISAFRGCKKLSDIAISSSIKTIGDLAFAESSLSAVQITSNDTIIGIDSFYWCLNLKTVNLPDEFDSFNAFAYTPVFHNITPDFVIDGTVLIKYQGKGGDIIIPSGITEIAKGAFDNVLYLQLGGEEITRVYVPDSVKKIAEHSFFACTELIEVSVPPHTEIDDNAFLECHPKFKLIIRKD